MENPCTLTRTFGETWRRGTYVPRNPYKTQIVATVDVMWSSNEIMMHDETNNVPFTITPHKLRKEWKRI